MAEEKKCAICGTQLLRGETRCIHCGKEVQSTEAVPLNQRAEKKAG
jgi:DNA-directed RNA polymerase subunit RPC12/RpoP